MASYKDYLNGSTKITKENLSKAVSTLSAVANKRLKRLESKGWYYAYGKGDSERSESIAGEKKFGAAGKSEQELKSEFKRLSTFFKSGVSSITEIKKQAQEFQIQEEELADMISQYAKESEHDIRDIGQYVRYKTDNTVRDDESAFEEVEFKTEKEWKDYEQAVKAESSRADKRGREFEAPTDRKEWYNQWLDGINLYNYMIETKQYIPSRVDSDQTRKYCEQAVINPNLKTREEQVMWVLKQAGMPYEEVEVNDYGEEKPYDTSTFLGPNI